MEKTFFLCLFLLSSFAFHSDESSSKWLSYNGISAAKFNESLQKLHRQESLQSASLSVTVLDAQGKIISNHNGGQSLATASTMKSITTATALLVLGENFQFETHLGYKGKIINGVLKGNIYIKGGGDPSLGAEDYQKVITAWASKIKAKGIRKIEGFIVADAQVFETQLTPNTWVWEDIGNYYGAGASGLNINKNTYHLYFKPSKAYSKAEVQKTVPKIPNLEFMNEMRTASPSSGDNGYIYGTPYSYVRYLRGTIPAKSYAFSIKGAIPDPALFTAQALRETLIQQNIQVTKRATTMQFLPQNIFHKQQFQLLEKTKSVLLKELVKQTNHKSINLYAEAILKMVGYKLKGKASTKLGTKAVMGFWKNKGIDTNGFFMEDGSGLSRFNAITSEQMAQMLYAVSKEKVAVSFKNSLPIVGQSGTVKNTCKYNFAKGRANAKSGFVKRVKGLVGWLCSNLRKSATYLCNSC